MKRRFRRQLFATVATAAVVAVIASACSGSSNNSSKPPTGGKAIKGGTATFALPPNATPNYIFPFSSVQYFSVVNANVQNLLYRPLYWFADGDQVNLNVDRSLAKAPTYSDGGKTVTLQMKSGLKWSDGEPVSTANVMFWYNMMLAQKKNYAAYVPGTFPDNVKSVTVDSPTKMEFHLKQKYSSYWFTYNQLGQIVPMPTAWDKTASGKSDCIHKVSDCTAVYKYLDGQAKKTKTYDSNPLWQVVDGPWKLKSFNVDGNVSFVPNQKYTGTHKAKLAEFKMLPFTTDTAEYNVLQSKKNSSDAITVGYIPASDVPNKPKGQDVGPNPGSISDAYSLAPWVGWSVNYFPLNLNNPTIGKVFKQEYFRQAFQHLVDQDGVINGPMKGYGYRTPGPVPLKPETKFLSSLAKSGGLTFDVNKAKQLLTSHGWNVKPDGVTTCQKPGTGSNQCGKGVTAGQKLSFTIQWATGNQVTSQIMQELKSNASKAGIQINLKGTNFNNVIGTAVPCKTGANNCNWEAGNWGGGWVFVPDYYPTGEVLWQTGAGSNASNYSDPKADQLIVKTETDSSVDALHQYEDYLINSAPVVWTPQQDYALTEVSKKIRGVTPQSPLLTLAPEDWYFVK